MGSIRVNVKLFGTLRDRISGGYDHGKGLSVTMDEGGTIRDLLSVLGLSENEARLFFVGGVSKQLGDGLNDSDEISIFLPLAGG
jgi:molybdopterin converting factor small subunit